MKQIISLLIALLVIDGPAMAQNPEKAKKLTDQGRQHYLRFSQEDYTLAIGEYKKALSEDSGYAPAYAAMAEALTLTGYEKERAGVSGVADYQAALTMAQKAMMKNAQLAVSHRAYAQVLLNMDAKQFGEKIHDALQTAIELDSLDAESYYLLWLHTENDKPDSPFIRLALKLNPKLFQAHYGVGLLYARQKKFDQAIEHYKTCVVLNPKNYRPYFSLGNAYSQQKNFEASIPEYEKAIKINPALTEAYFYLGVAQYYLNKNKDARKNLERYLELNPATTYRTQVEGILKELR